MSKDPYGYLRKGNIGILRREIRQIPQRLLQPFRLWRNRTFGEVSWIFLLAEFMYRPWLRRVIFIGVTGSAGKTTTKDLTEAVLSSRFKGIKSRYNENGRLEVVKTIFRTRPWHTFLVQELTAGSKDNSLPLGDNLRLVQPQIGVVTNIGSDHLSLFHTEEAIAAEKSKLIAALPKHGTAILNADDEKVLAMQAKCAGHVLTYGLSPVAMVRAVNISSRWPERLSFTVLYNGQSQVIQTQLCGTHWVPCVLAALAVGVVMGVPLATAAQAVQTVEAFKGRMSPLTLLDNVTIIRDDCKAPLWAIPTALNFLQDAEGKRKIVIMGTISDMPRAYRGRKASSMYVQVAREALDVADYVFFVGPWSAWALRARRDHEEDRVRAFSNVQTITKYLKSFLEPGDLVLLKGSSSTDNFERIISGLEKLGEEQEIPSIASPAGYEASALHGEASLGTFPKMPMAGSKCACQVVVGLGNWGTKYDCTPHNVGHRVVDRLLQTLGGEWTQEDQVMMARVEWREKSFYLVKPMTWVNHTGSVLPCLSSRIGCSPAEFIFIVDDLDLPLGSIRQRIRGSSGGHKGIGSIIDIFQTEEFRRVKIGVGKPREHMSVTEHVLTPFSPSDKTVIDRACDEAADRVLKLVASYRTPDPA